MNEWFRLNEKRIYRVYNAGILTCIGLFGAGVFQGIGEVSAIHLFTAAGVLAVLTGINFLPARGRMACALALTVCLCAAVLAVGWETALSFLRLNFRWLSGDEGAREQWTTGCELVQTALLAALCYLIQILFEKYPVLKSGLTVLLSAALWVCLFARITMSHLGVVFLISYIAVNYVEWMQRRWEKVRSRSIKAHMFWTAPFMALYFLLMIFMPVSEKPYDWQWLKNICRQFRESFLTVTQDLMRGGREDFEMSMSGFSEGGRLGGSVLMQDREIMIVRGPNRIVTNLYLTGNVFDTFDGREWGQEYHGSARERFLDTAETLYAARRFDDEFFHDYMYETKLSIRYRYLNTGYVFSPLKTWSLKEKGEGLNLFGDGGNLLFEEAKGYGMEYEVEYFQMNVGQEVFDRLLEAESEPDEKIWKKIAQDYEWKNGEEIALEEVREHRQEIYDHYLGEVELSEEMYAYLSEITRDAETDLEKLRAIERELASFTYTQTPDRLPEEIADEGGFLDYFLLESREGYCTYFATAFVLLARAEGIPARYVQGFCIPAKGYSEFHVTSDMAHAWPEAYMDGVGWIPFEPTPGYAGLRYASWRLMQNENAALSEREADWNRKNEKKDGKTGEGQEDAELEAAGSGEMAKGFWRLAGPAALAVLACAAGVLALEHILCGYRYRRMEADERFRVEVLTSLRVLSFLGFKREDGETLQELRERAELMLKQEKEERGGEASAYPSLQFIENYENMAYGGKKAGEDMIEEAKAERERLLRLLKGRRKRLYVYCRIQLYLTGYGIRS